MTRQDFIENVNHWWELLEFCYNEDCDVCEDIISDEDRDYEINESVREYHTEYSWFDLRDMLRGIETGYEYYRRDGSFDYCGMDDGSDFDEYKDAVIEWMDDGGYWEDEEDEDDYTEETIFDDDNAPVEYEELDEESAPDEDFSVGELMGMCCVAFVTIQQDNERREQENAAALQQYLNEMPKVLR